MEQQQVSATSTSPILTISTSNLRVAYESVVALSLPSLQCSGGIISVVGHNGAGKSTLIKSVLGLLPPTSGTLSTTLSVNGVSAALVPENDMAFCPETGAVFADISVESY